VGILLEFILKTLLSIGQTRAIKYVLKVLVGSTEINLIFATVKLVITNLLDFVVDKRVFVNYIEDVFAFGRNIIWICIFESSIVLLNTCLLQNKATFD
jgi:hypothetical protein